jgi:uncharacterized Zn finger protein
MRLPKWSEPWNAWLLCRMEKLMKRLREHVQFEDYLAGLRAEHKRKRNFMKLLDKFG